MDQARFSARIGKSRNLFKIVSVLLSTSVKKVGVSRMRDFFYMSLVTGDISTNHEFMNKSVAKVFVEEPWLHRVC